MERRSFLRGVFGGVTAGGIILAAPAKELEAFAAPLVANQPLIIDPMSDLDVGIGQRLYNEHGESVAVVTAFHVKPEFVHFRGLHGPLPRSTFRAGETMFLEAQVFADKVELEYRLDELTRIGLRRG